MYDYEPLPDAGSYIRILTIEKGQYKAPLRGSLSTTTIEKAKPYDAISYCWGEIDYTCGIWLWSESDDEYVSKRISQNLDSGLRRIWKETEDVRLWNDALCINQNKKNLQAVAEKSQQVQLMSKIYAAANVVIIYLGEEDTIGKSLEACRILERLDEAALTTPINDARTSMQWIWKHRLSQATASADWEPLKTFFRRPWFQRAWIVQECFMAKEAVFVCGEWRMNWISHAQSHPDNLQIRPWRFGLHDLPHAAGNGKRATTRPQSIQLHTHTQRCSRSKLEVLAHGGGVPHASCESQ